MPLHHPLFSEQKKLGRAMGEAQPERALRVCLFLGKSGSSTVGTVFKGQRSHKQGSFTLLLPSSAPSLMAHLRMLWVLLPCGLKEILLTQPWLRLRFLTCSHHAQSSHPDYGVVRFPPSLTVF